MHSHLALVLARRIERLNREFARWRVMGGDPAPFYRRARSLSVAYCTEVRRFEELGMP